MADIGSLLRRTKSFFEGQGIRGAPQIAEHLSFLLLVHEHNRQPGEEASASWTLLSQVKADNALQEKLDQLQAELRDAYPNAHEIIPQPPPARLGTIALDEVMEALATALKECNADAGRLFQYHLRFEVLKESKGGQYPTPHHIATAMTRVIDLQTGQTVVDPTCGTGGLLVSASDYLNDQALSVTGCDFDPTWAALAWSNLVLHGRYDAEIKIASALSLRLAEKAERPAPERRFFERLLMNPPFGGSRSQAELKDTTLGTKYGGRNETVLSALAMELLAPQGRAAILVSRGLLFGGGSEQELRSRLLQEQLEAVVTLPEDALQPYNNVSANLLVLQKAAGEPRPINPVWFFHLHDDGYPPGAGRDLTQEPNSISNELPLFMDALLAFRAQQPVAQLTDQNGVVIAYGLPLRPADGAPGYLAALNSTLAGYKIKAMQLNNTNDLLVTPCQDDRAAGWIRLYHDNTAPVVGAAHQMQPFDWHTLPVAVALREDLPTKWAGAADDESSVITCTINQEQQTLNLKNKTTSYQLKQLPDDANPPTIAILVSDDGQVLSPLLTAMNDGAPVDVDPSKIEGPETIAIRGTDGAPIGRVISLSSNQEDEDENAEPQVDSAYLIIWTRLDASVFVPYPDRPITAFLLDTGLLTIDRSEDHPRISVEIGKPIQTKPEQPPRGLVMTTEGVTLGVLLDRNQISHADANGNVVADVFEPRAYLAEVGVEKHESAARILANIRQNQAKLGSRIDALLGRVATPAKLEQPLPPVVINMPIMLEHLNNTQKRIWETVCAQRHEATALHFQARNIAETLKAQANGADDLKEEEIELQLDVFERLGAIVRVTVQQQMYYRLATPLDDDTRKESRKDAA